VRIEVSPISGAELVAWLLALEDAGGDGARLERFDGDSATFVLPMSSLPALVDAAQTAGLPVHATGDQLGRPAIGASDTATEAATAAPRGEWRLAHAAPADTPGAAAATASGREDPDRRHLPPALVVAGLIVLALLLVIALTRTLGRSDAEAPPIGVPSEQEPAAVAHPGSPAPTAAAPPLRRVERDRSGTCIPLSGMARCDPLRAALWSGDAAAWRAWSTALGEPPPSGDELIERVLALRALAGDPAARIDLARAEDLPLPLIGEVYLREDRDGVARVAGAVVENAGTRPAELSGVAVVPLARIAAGFRLGAGERCGVGDLPPALRRCPAEALPGAPRSEDGRSVQLRTPAGIEIDRFSPP
jgi:hypothetical protein